MKKTEDLTHINLYTILADESSTFNHNWKTPRGISIKPRKNGNQLTKWSRLAAISNTTYNLLVHRQAFHYRNTP
ncbi:MAG TPA: hypothetical protein VK553_02755, partial [Candidatus Nitrosopolaris rasttigaisensis]|nr:hypothetical protein [Candidatus Nitrosopolaris rasttigaisensis]